MKVVNHHALKFAFFVGRVPPRPLSATFVIKAGFRLSPGGIAELLPEAEQPEFSGDRFHNDDPAQGLRYPSDFALFKPGADLLLAGHCHAPEGQPIRQSEVAFGVGASVKRLAVFGDRFWIRDPLGASASQPLPFVSMPLTWARAFGGPDDANNQVGRGLGEGVLPTGASARPLPNIESIHALVTSPYDRPSAAGFGPVAATSAPRAGKTGTYDQQWLQQRWPWLPDDFDWTFFNAAPPDQQRQGAFLRGDEVLRFDGMHPRCPSYTCRLPGDRLRLFVKRRRGNALAFEEVAGGFDTLFADMDAENAVLIWRGVTAADSMKCREFEEVFVVKEPLYEPAADDLAGYEELFERRKAEAARAEMLEFTPIDPVVVVPPRMPDTSWADRLQAEIDSIEKPDAASGHASLAAEWKDAFGVDMPLGDMPPAAAVPGSLAEIDALLQQEIGRIEALEPGTAKPFKAHPVDLGALQQQLDEDERDRSAPLPENDDEDEPSAWTRERVEKRAAEGGGFDGEDLSGLDLAGLDFSRLSFREAVLDAARLTQSVLDGCDLTGASLVGASLHLASFRDSRLENADLSEAVGPGSIWHRAELTCATFSMATLPTADFRRSTGRHASFDGCDLTQAQFEECHLVQADFTKASLAGAQFTRAIVPDAGFYDVTAPGANFAAAQIPRGRFTGAHISNCSFAHCVLDDGILENARLTRSDFTEAGLARAIFTGARAAHAVFRLARCEHAKFDDAVVSEAAFIQTNLFRATFENADLTNATLLGSNCYEVEFFQTVTSGASFEEANLKGTKLV